MGLRDVTREAVLAAVAEYDELGQNDFLRKYGFSGGEAKVGSPASGCLTAITTGRK